MSDFFSTIPCGLSYVPLQLDFSRCLHKPVPGQDDLLCKYRGKYQGEVPVDMQESRICSKKP